MSFDGLLMGVESSLLILLLLLLNVLFYTPYLDVWRSTHGSEELIIMIVKVGDFNVDLESSDVYSYSFSVIYTQGDSPFSRAKCLTYSNEALHHHRLRANRLRQ